MRLIVLAAGASSRMGEPKGLVRLPDGRTWFAAQLAALPPVIARVTVILGFHADRYRAEVPELNAPNIGVLTNPRPEPGAFSSLQTGLRCVAGAAFILPVDVPVAKPATWEALARAAKDGQSAVPTDDADRGGHPVLVSMALAAHLVTLDPAAPESRLDVQMRAFPHIRVPVGDPAIRCNLNTQADLAAWLALQG